MSEMLKIENIRKVFNPGTINEKVALDGVRGYGRYSDQC